MRRLNSNIDKIFFDFQSLLKQKPSYAVMLEEIRMMKFRVRPVSGDISFVNLRDSQFIETIWSMGKLEEVVQREYPKLTVKGKEALFRLFDSLHEKFQEQLNKLNLKPERSTEKPHMVEMEIFKETPQKKLN